MALAFVFQRQKNLVVRNTEKPEKKLLGEVSLSILRASFHHFAAGGNIWK